MNRKFIWEKKGLIFVPDDRFEWLNSYAQNPSVLVLKDRLRIYINTRPAPGKDGLFTSVITFLDVDKHDPSKIIYVHDKPLLNLGDLGCFDQHGTMCGNVIRHNNLVFMYYVGWQRCRGVPYNQAIGLAISKDKGRTFKRYNRGPVITQTPSEPFIQNSPFAIIINNKFYIWYSSGIGWIESGGRIEPVYVLMRATSDDGINWIRDGKPCVPSKVEYECQTSPCIIKIEGIYHMWFCYRYGLDFRNAERGYRIGYAYSKDLIRWVRNDGLADLEPSSSGWDSQMVCYPNVVKVENELHVFYSGNYFGRDGFGYATLKK